MRRHVDADILPGVSHALLEGHESIELHCAGGPTLLKPETIALMMQNQLPAGMHIRFPRLGEISGKGFGLGGAPTLAPSPIEPAAAAGEFQWGGIAGTHWWISPRANLAGLLMTQRQWAFWHPFSFEFRQRAYQAVGAGRGKSV